MKPEISLQAVKVLHTVVWGFFVLCIAAIPVFGILGFYGWAAAFFGIVLLEVLVLLMNGMRCPLTDVAARYTEEREANFDIYLPLWVAKHNKLIFGLLYLGGTLYTLVRWAGWIG